MNTYIINSSDDVRINFAPSNTIEEVIQNVRCLISTIKWQIPLARDVGISGDIVDMPILQAKARLTQEIIQCLKKYEPRAQIKKIEFSGDATGRLKPRLEIVIIEEN
ncbi:MAG: hypothetical protein IJ728_12775 [Selenomonadaceae bacterium]|nr:hypothetical protein [Selenomonadaceae bacterium]